VYEHGAVHGHARTVIGSFPCMSQGTPTSAETPTHVLRQGQMMGDHGCGVILTVSPLMIPLVYCHIKSFQRATSVEKPLLGGENRIDGRASHPVCATGLSLIAIGLWSAIIELSRRK
jgi:hypothetical protein